MNKFTQIWKKITQTWFAGLRVFPGLINDCLSRQVAEGFEIRRCEYQVMNAKTEWHQPAL